MMVLQKRSAGAVVYTELLRERYYLILLYGAGHWDLPKGGIEGGEDELDTVRREVWEETGINDIEIIDGFRRTITYFYRSGDALVKKTVVFYIARTSTMQVRLSKEHNAYAWLKVTDAIEQLTYKTAKDLLREADEYLESLNRRNKQRTLI